MKKLIIVFGSAVFISMVLAISTCSIGYASSDAYNSGYHHGCNDADKPVNERYINEVGNGPSHHTDEFMDEYHQGLHDCSSGAGAYSQDTSNFPELKQGEHYGTCEERSVGLVCDIEHN